MDIRVNRISVIAGKDGYLDIVVPPALTEEFCKMLHRAFNTWENPSFELRDFADRITRTGKYIPKDVYDFRGVKVGKLIPVPPDYKFPPILVKEKLTSAGYALRTCCNTYVHESHTDACTDAHIRKHIELNSPDDYIL